MVFPYMSPHIIYIPGNLIVHERGEPGSGVRVRSGRGHDGHIKGLSIIGVMAGMIHYINCV